MIVVLKNEYINAPAEILTINYKCWSLWARLSLLDHLLDMPIIFPGYTNTHQIVKNMRLGALFLEEDFFADIFHNNY
jgi:hypothetical protein